MKFTEERLEQAIIELFAKEEIPHARINIGIMRFDNVQHFPLLQSFSRHRLRCWSICLNPRGIDDTSIAARLTLPAAAGIARAETNTP